MVDTAAGILEATLVAGIMVDSAADILEATLLAGILRLITRRAYYGLSLYRGQPYYDTDYSMAVELQISLARRGYYGGSIDGVIGRQTRMAIRHYQRDRGLTVTGRMDRRVLRALGIT
jgi:hypothetical protein